MCKHDVIDKTLDRFTRSEDENTYDQTPQGHKSAFRMVDGGPVGGVQNAVSVRSRAEAGSFRGVLSGTARAASTTARHRSYLLPFGGISAKAACGTRHINGNASELRLVLALLILSSWGGLLCNLRGRHKM